MCFDGAGEHFEFDDSVGTDRHDVGDPGLGTFVTNDGVGPDGWYESGAGVDHASEQVAVVGHVHEVDGQVGCEVHDVVLLQSGELY
jgi:hypothetical protein